MADHRIQVLFERHHLVLFRALRRMTGDAALAEDLVQDTFARALRAADGYEERGSERAWLFAIARRLLADRRRAESRRPRVEPLEETPESGRRSATQSNPDLRLCLERALGDLAADEREAFVLREVGGLGHEEIAAVTEATRPAVRNRIHRARLALREALSPGLPHRSRTSKGDRG